MLGHIESAQADTPALERRVDLQWLRGLAGWLSTVHMIHIGWKA